MHLLLSHMWDRTLKVASMKIYVGFFLLDGGGCQHLLRKDRGRTERCIFLFIIQNSLWRFCGIDRCVQYAQYVKCKRVPGWLRCLLDTNREWPKVRPTAPDPALGFRTISSITGISSIMVESEIAPAIKCRCFHYATATISTKPDNEKTWQPAVIAKFLLVCLFIYLFFFGLYAAPVSRGLSL